MEESCLYSRHQERDSITGICLGVPQCVGNPLQTPTGRKTNRACVFHAVWTAWHSGFDTITLIHLEKAELTLFFFFFLRCQFLFLNFIFHWTWDHLGALRWTNQMGFYLRSGIQRQDLESKFLCHVSDFLWPDGNISSPVHWWERNIQRIYPHLRPNKMEHINVFRD